MLQTALIFAFGFLAATLLALMAAPAVWRRAGYLTRKRIEAALPLSINELNAEKDALRAEHAMAMRRMELRLKDTRESDNVEKVLIEEQGETIRTLEGKLSETRTRSVEFERQLAELTGRLHERITEMSELSVLLESTRAELDIRSSELKAATRLREERASQLKEVSAELQTLRDDLSDRDHQIESLCETIATLKAAGQNLKREVVESNTDGQVIGDLLSSERKRMAQTETKLEQALAQAGVLKEKIRRREADVAAMREQESAAVADLRRAESARRTAEAERAELARALADMEKRLEALQQTFGDRKPEAVVEELQAVQARQSMEIKRLESERDSLQKKLEAERDAMKVELAAASFGAAAESDEGDAILREKLNQLAAEVVAMAARLEGPESRINTLLEQIEPAKKGDIVSLAERIKALQRSADRQRSTA